MAVNWVVELAALKNNDLVNRPLDGVFAVSFCGALNSSVGPVERPLTRFTGADGLTLAH